MVQAGYWLRPKLTLRVSVRARGCATHFDWPNSWGTCRIPASVPARSRRLSSTPGLDRHQVAALLKNEVKYIPMQALSRLCDYLIEYGYVSADQLPGALFAVEPEHFWELLARRRRLEMCLGVRRGEEDEWPVGAWVVASDSVLLGELLNGVSSLGGTAKHLQREKGSEYAVSSLVPHPEHLKQSLVWSPGQVPLEEVIARARERLRQFLRVRAATRR